MLLLLLLTMIFGIQKGTAQSSLVPKYLLSYTETISTNYEVDLNARNSLKPVEAAGMKPVNEVRNVSIAVDQNNDVATTINIVSSNASESWMKPPAKIVVDKTGTKLYDTKNALLTQDAYTTAQSEQYQAIKSNVAANGIQPLPSFNPITAANITQLQSQGFTVQTLEGGVVKLRKGDLEIRYNNTAKSMEVTKYEGANPSSKTTFNYRVENGKTLPSSKIERDYKVTTTGICYTRVTTTTFSNYVRPVNP